MQAAGGEDQAGGVGGLGGPHTSQGSWARPLGAVPEAPLLLSPPRAAKALPPPWHLTWERFALVRGEGSTELLLAPAPEA